MTDQNKYNAAFPSLEHSVRPNSSATTDATYDLEMKTTPAAMSINPHLCTGKVGPVGNIYDVLMRAPAPKSKTKAKKGTKRIITPNATPPKDKTQKKTEAAADAPLNPTTDGNKVVRCLDMESLSNTLDDSTDAAKQLLNAGHAARSHSGRGKGTGNSGGNKDGGGGQPDQVMNDKVAWRKGNAEEKDDDDDDDDDDQDHGPDPFGEEGDVDIVIWDTLRLRVPESFFDPYRAGETLTFERMGSIVSDFILSKALQYKRTAEDIFPNDCKFAPFHKSKALACDWFIDCPNLATFDAIRMAVDTQKLGKGRFVPAIPNMAMFKPSAGFFDFSSAPHLALVVELSARHTSTIKLGWREFQETFRLELEDALRGRFMVDAVLMGVLKTDHHSSSSSTSTNSGTSYKSSSQAGPSATYKVRIHLSNPKELHNARMSLLALSASKTKVAGIALPAIIKVKGVPDAIVYCSFCQDRCQADFVHTNSRVGNDVCPEWARSFMIFNNDRSQPIVLTDRNHVVGYLSKLGVTYNLTMGLDEAHSQENASHVGCLKVTFLAASKLSKAVMDAMNALKTTYRVIAFADKGVNGACTLCNSLGHFRAQCEANPNRTEYFTLCDRYKNTIMTKGSMGCPVNCPGGHPAAIVHATTGLLCQPPDVVRIRLLTEKAKKDLEEAKMRGADPSGQGGPREEQAKPKYWVLDDDYAATNIQLLNTDDYTAANIPTDFVAPPQFKENLPADEEVDIRTGSDIGLDDKLQYGGYANTVYNSMGGASETLDLGAHHEGRSALVTVVAALVNLTMAPKIGKPIKLVDGILHDFSASPKLGVRNNEATKWKLWEEGEFFSDRCNCHADPHPEIQKARCDCTVRVNPHGPLNAIANARPRVDLGNLEPVANNCFRSHVVELMMKDHEANYSVGYQAMAFERTIEGLENANEYVSLAHIQLVLCKLGHRGAGLNCFVVCITYDKSTAPSTAGSKEMGYVCHMGKGSVTSLAGRGYDPQADSFFLMRRAILAKEPATSSVAPPKKAYHYVYSSLYQLDSTTGARVNTWDHEHALVQRARSILLKQKGKSTRNESNARGGNSGGRGSSFRDQGHPSNRSSKRRKEGNYKK
jgi:hypothetical protein